MKHLVLFILVINLAVALITSCETDDQVVPDTVSTFNVQNTTTDTVVATMGGEFCINDAVTHTFLPGETFTFTDTCPGDMKKEGQFNVSIPRNCCSRNHVETYYYSRGNSITVQINSTNDSF